MKKEGAKPADKPVDYSALKDITYSVFEDKFKDNYFKIISGEGRVEYSAKVIDLCHDKIKLNLADGTEKK